MIGHVNRKIVGAFVVGVGFVSIAYIYNNLSLSQISHPAAVNRATVPTRTAITVTDKDSNGVEDWRDTFATTKAVIADTGSTTYEYPTTVTGQLSIQFLEDFIRSKYAGPFAPNKEQIVERTVDSLSEATKQKLFDTRDVIIMDRWTSEDVKTYANAMATALDVNNLDGSDTEMDILNDVLNNGKTERLPELKALADMYRNILEDSKAIPVPAPLLKQHLDLLNSYSALEGDISAMSVVNDDPMIAFVRFKRYTDDATALRLSGENMYNALQPYAGQFTESDPAIIFSAFSASNQRI
jgi:hypothetical protein